MPILYYYYYIVHQKNNHTNCRYHPILVSYKKIILRTLESDLQGHHNFSKTIIFDFRILIASLGFGLIKKTRMMNCVDDYCDRDGDLYLVGFFQSHNHQPPPLMIVRNDC